MANEKNPVVCQMKHKTIFSNESLLVAIFVRVVSLTSQNENVIFTG